MKVLIGCVLLVTFCCCAAQDPVEAYIEEYRDLAISEMERTGIPASIKLAQAIHESNAGQSVLATKAKNHFGIKCGSRWNGRSVRKKDDDYENGRLKKSCFRAYSRNRDSFIDHSEFLRDPNKENRYGFLFELDPKDYKKWAYGLKKAGYATARNYHKKLIEIIKRYNLDKYDDWGMEFEEEMVADEQPLLAQAPINGYLYNNDVRYVLAKNNETVAELAARAETTASRIIRYNEGLQSESDRLVAGERIYLQPKRSSYRGRKRWHEVQQGEDMYKISQIYGLRLDILYRRNAMEPGQEPLAGVKIKINGSPLEVPPTIERDRLSANTTARPVLVNNESYLEMGEEVIQAEELPKAKEEPIIPKVISDKPHDDEELEMGEAVLNENGEIPVRSQNKPYRRVADNAGGPNTGGNSINNDPNRINLPIMKTESGASDAAIGQEGHYYEVKSGDTLWNISKRFNITIEQLVKWNNLRSNTIKLGMKLKVVEKI